MENMGVITLLLIIANFAFSYKGFKDVTFLDAYKFEVDAILIKKEYKRLITSNFLHVSWPHLIFNMISLFSFSELVETHLGWLSFLLIYMASAIGGDLLALFIHRHHGDYSSVGASGAVCGVIFASIALFPGLEIGMIFIPVSIPAWIYGVLYIAYSIYGVKSKRDNIGHEAHLGGALIGMLVAIVFRPEVLQQNYLTISIITLPTLVFIYLIVKKPYILLVENYFYDTHQRYDTIDHKYNAQKVMKQRELDRLLDKINKKGIDSLTKAERLKLDEYSQAV